MMASRGFFKFTASIQNMLLDCGYADKVCKFCNGMFLMANVIVIIYNEIFRNRKQIFSKR